MERFYRQTLIRVLETNPNLADTFPKWILRSLKIEDFANDHHFSDEEKS